MSSIIPALHAKQRCQQWQTYPVFAAHLPGASGLSNSSALRELRETGSLTARLTALSGNRFRVQVLAQRWGRAEFSECLALGIDTRSAVLVREVILYGADQPWVYARSILPATSLKGPLLQLKQLNTRPLGGWLFSQPSMRREPMQFALIEPGAEGVSDTELPQTKGPKTQPVLGRRSVFYVYDKPILVAEMFLPQLVDAFNHQGDEG